MRPLLTEFWRDVISTVSLALTVIGFLFTTLSLVYAIRQIWKTQSAADAAALAARQAVDESRKSFESYALSNALRFFSEARVYVAHSLWDKASLRLGDLADQTSQLANQDDAWKEFSVELREWSQTMAKMSVSKTSFSSKRWGEFERSFQGKIDESHGPFKSISERGTK